MGSFIFYGWGLGFWMAAPAPEMLLPIALFLAVQLPLSAWWLPRFRYGPVETSGAGSPTAGWLRLSANASCEQGVRAAPHRRVVGPGVDHHLVELEVARQLADLRAAARPSRRRPRCASARGSAARPRRSRARRWHPATAGARARRAPIDAPAVARERQVRRLLVAVGGERPDAERGLRHRMALARLEALAIERHRHLGALAVGEEVGEGIGQAEVGRELRAVVGAAEDPDLRRVRSQRMGGDAGVGADEVQACRSRTCTGKSSAAWLAFGFRARAVRMSPPGARPTPRSIRPGASASRTRNCSATLRAL